MKSSNYYKRIALILVLALLLLAMLVACDGGEGVDETSKDAPNETTEGIDPAGSTEGGENGDNSDPAGSDETTGSAGGDETSGSSNGTETGGSSSGGDETTGSAGGSSGGSSSDPSAGGSSSTATVTYTVTVVDGAGNPIKNVIVKLSTGKQSATGTNGTATIKASAGSYTFTLEMIGAGSTEYLYDTSACVLSTEKPAVTITFVEKVSTETEGSTDSGNSGSSGGDSGTTDEEPTGDTIWADPDGDDTRTEYYAPYVYTGSVAVDLVANDMTYVLFYPQVAGQYRISATCSTATVSVGNYGVPSYVQTNNIATTAGVSYFEINVRAGSVKTLESGTLIVVVGLKTTNGSAGSALLTIERFADALTDTAEVPFEVIKAESEYLKATPAVSGTLTDIDITQQNITIVKGSDGYYHYGSESGPIVMIRLSTASPYIDSFVKIGECQTIPYYEYDSNGNFVRKESWNGVVTAYAAYANSDGVVPLNDQLITMMKRVGAHMGWWDEDHPQYLFKEVNEVTENAYLFACCYYA